MLVFHYGSEGVIGFTYQGIGEYYYKKNIFGDVIGIIDNNGQEITKYIYDAWGNHKTFVLDNNQYVDISTHLDYTQSGLNNKTIALLNPFRYRSYYYDEETKLYYLNSRYYDPQIGRFINADDIPYLDKSNFNGLNLYTYCLNNPIKYADFWGNSILSLFIILLTTTIIGAVGNGIKAYNEGSRGWDLIGNILIGASFGLAAGGALIAVGAVVTGAIFRIGASLFGVGVSQAFAIGALAFNFTAYIVAPIIGIEMTGIEFENPNYEDSFTPSETNSSPSYIINLKLSLNCNPRSKNYDYLFRKFVKRL